MLLCYPKQENIDEIRKNMQEMHKQRKKQFDMMIKQSNSLKAPTAKNRKAKK